MKNLLLIIGLAIILSGCQKDELLNPIDPSTGASVKFPNASGTVLVLLDGKDILKSSIDILTNRTSGHSLVFSKLNDTRFSLTAKDGLNYITVTYGDQKSQFFKNVKLNTMAVSGYKYFDGELSNDVKHIVKNGKASAVYKGWVKSTSSYTNDDRNKKYEITVYVNSISFLETNL